jgi:hypothetical protein
MAGLPDVTGLLYRADWTRLSNVMGFGRPAADFDQRRFSYGKVSFGPSLELVADTLSIPLDWVEAGGEVAVARHRVRIAAGTLEAGTVAAQRMGATSPAYTANRAVNAVPYVCAALPGIRTSVDLPQIIASFA